MILLIIVTSATGGENYHTDILSVIRMIKNTLYMSGQLRIGVLIYIRNIRNNQDIRDKYKNLWHNT